MNRARVGLATTSAFLFAANPGTIAGVIMSAVTRRNSGLPVSALVGVTAAMIETKMNYNWPG